MDESKATAVLTALASGVNPQTGEVFPPESVYQSAEVVRALYVAIRALEPSLRRRTRARGSVPANAGKPWSEEEDQALLAEFDEGRSIAELAEAHGRTQAGIQARLERHGRIQAPFVTRSLQHRRDGQGNRPGDS